MAYCLNEYSLGVARAYICKWLLRELVPVEMAQQHAHHSTNVLEPDDNVIDVVQFGVLVPLVFKQQLIEQRISRDLKKPKRHD